MLSLKLSRCLTTIKHFKPAFPVKFDQDGRLLLYSTPSATTFLRIFAPINIGFILVHGYLSVAEYMNPIIEGKYTYLLMTSSLLGLGIGMAASVEIFARKFVKSIYLMNDGKTLSIEFHNAFIVIEKQPARANLVVNVNDCYGLDEIYSQNFKLSIKNMKDLYLNMDRNEIKDEKLITLLSKVIEGFTINTVGDKNLNKFFKKF